MYLHESFLKRKDWCHYYYFNVKIKTCRFWNSPYMYPCIDLPLIDHDTLDRNAVGIVTFFFFFFISSAAHFSKRKSQIKKRSERRSVYRRDDFVYIRIYHTVVKSPHTYIRIQLAYKRGSYIFWSLFSLFLRFIIFFFFFSSLPPLFFFPCRSCLLYYFVTGLRSCFFVVFFFFFFHSVLSSVHPLFARFFPFFLLSNFFCSSFLSPLSLLLTTQRGIRTLDFSTTKLENKRRNVSH